MQTSASNSELKSLIEQVNGVITDSFGEGTGHYVVKVPIGTEKQAVEYLRSQKPLIFSAGLSQIGCTQ